MKFCLVLIGLVPICYVSNFSYVQASFLFFLLLSLLTNKLIEKKILLRVVTAARRLSDCQRYARVSGRTRTGRQYNEFSPHYDRCG